jgi:hypothetical protein
MILLDACGSEEQVMAYKRLRLATRGHLEVGRWPIIQVIATLVRPLGVE